MPKRKSFVFILLLAALTLVLSACGGSKNKVVVSGKPWTEQYILPHIIGELIESETDIDVDYQDGLGEVAILTPAIKKGEIDIYVEYTGTGLKDVLEEDTEPGETAESIYDRVQEGYDDQYDVTWLDPLGFENGYTLVYAPDVDYEAETASDLADISQEEDLVFGAPHAFYERKGEGYEDLVKAYPFEFKDQKSVDPNIMYDAVMKHEVDVIPGFTTESRIDKFDLETTEDDEEFFPKYEAVPLVRNEVLDDMPELEDVINQLAGEITNEDMLKMNAKVDEDDEKPEDVAHDFLVEKGLIEE